MNNSDRHALKLEEDFIKKTTERLENLVTDSFRKTKRIDRGGQNRRIGFQRPAVNFQKTFDHNNLTRDPEILANVCHVCCLLINKCFGKVSDHVWTRRMYNVETKSGVEQKEVRILSRLSLRSTTALTMTMTLNFVSSYQSCIRLAARSNECENGYLSLAAVTGAFEFKLRVLMTSEPSELRTKKASFWWL